MNDYVMERLEDGSFFRIRGEQLTCLPFLFYASLTLTSLSHPLSLSLALALSSTPSLSLDIPVRLDGHVGGEDAEHICVGNRFGPATTSADAMDEDHVLEPTLRLLVDGHAPQQLPG